jgi:hypothetical protein
MLSLASLGMAFYGLWEAARAAADLVGPRALEFLADAATLGLGAILVLAAAFVRVRMPGGLALAIGALLGLQALALHSAAHLEGEVTLLPQVFRGAFAAILVLLAFLGSRRERASERS